MLFFYAFAPLSLLCMQMSSQFFFAVRLGIQHIVFLKRLQLMQEKHQYDADQKGD
jgi:hypothetical protein